MRLKYIDWCKGVGIIFILIGHIDAGLLNTSESFVAPLLRWGNSFKIIIFYVLSGYLFSYKNSRYISGKDYFLKRIKQLGYPYLLYSVPAILIESMYGIYKGEPLGTAVLTNFIDFVTLRGISTLWFLPCLFIAEILFCFINTQKYKCKTLSAISIIIVSVLIFNRSDVIKHNVLAMVFNNIGMVIEKGIFAFSIFSLSYYLSKYILKLPGLILAGGGIVSIMLSQFNNYIDLNNLKYGELPGLFIFTGLLATYSFMYIFKCLEEKKFRLAYLNFMGINSLFIMCTHLPLYITQVLCLILRKVYDLVIVPYEFQVFVAIIALSVVEYFLLKVWIYLKEIIKTTCIYNFVQYI